jgi:hypothetical protein
VLLSIELELGCPSGVGCALGSFDDGVIAGTVVGVLGVAILMAYLPREDVVRSQ